MFPQVRVNAPLLILASALLSPVGARGAADGSPIWDGFGIGSVPVTIEIPSITALPGESITISAVLHAGDNVVAAVQNDMAFDPDVAVAATADGKPDCTVDPDIDKPATAFVFRPIGCAPGFDCEQIRAIVLSITDTQPIADGAVLYTCQVDIAPDAPPGTYALTPSNMIGATPYGQRLETTASGGAIVVTEPVAQRALSLGSSAGADAGCAISTAPRRAPGSLVLLAAAMLWWRSRRVRDACPQRRR